MAKINVTQQECDAQDQQWEQDSYSIGCAAARQVAMKRLWAIEQKLYEQRPATLRVEGFRERTLVCVFGELRVSRRLYLEDGGGYHFLLDEYLGWEPEQVATPSVMESVVELATQVPLRQAAQTLNKLTAGVLSAMTIQRLAHKAADRALNQEHQAWQACFGRGEQVGMGKRVEVLYTEADGVWVHLQQEGQKHYELKSAIVYEGWENAGPQRYRLRGKRVYCHANSAIAFWEGASLEWAKHYDLAELKLMVVGGDGANWIAEGARLFGSALFQLDGFHLARACGRGFGKEMGQALYEAIRSGQLDKAHQLLAQAQPAITQAQDKSRRYVSANIVSGKDWRKQTTQVPFGARGLGTMESNGDKLVANRMKKRGMSWTIRGVQRMVKLLQLSANGELASVCKRSDAIPRSQPPKRLRQPENLFTTSGYKWVSPRSTDLTVLDLGQGPYATSHTQLTD